MTIPKGDTVTYDTGMASLGTTKLKTLTSSGKLVMAAGTLDTTGNLSTAGFNQTGGTLDAGGTFTIQSTSGAVTLGDITAGSLNINSTAGAISQLASTALNVSGAMGLTADNGASGTSDVKYNITLSDTPNVFHGVVSANGSRINLADSNTSGLTLGNVTAGNATVSGTLTVATRAGAIKQAAATALTVTGGTTLIADNGLTGSSDVKYGIKLANTANNFEGAVTSNALNINLADDIGGVIIGNTTATGTLKVTSLNGAITEMAGKTIDVAGTTTLTADNGVSGAGDVKYAVSLADTTNDLTGHVTAHGSTVTLYDATALTAILGSSGASTLTSVGAMKVSGSVGTTLKTTTAGTGAATTFGATTVGTSLAVTSTGAVTETAANILTVDGEGTTTVSNPHVTVNGVKGAKIPAP